MHRSELTSILRAELGKTLFPYRRVCLVGFPDHPNVGDSAIYRGETRLLADLNVRLVATAPYGSNISSFVSSLAEDVAILVQGGGNFGDLWPGTLEFIEHVVLAARDRHLVFAPQSVEILEPASVVRLGRAFEQKPDCILTVRDQRSLERVSKIIDCDVRLIPDGAFGLASLRPTRPLETQPFALLRDDHESSEWGGIPDAVQGDWTVDDQPVKPWWRAAFLAKRVFADSPGPVRNGRLASVARNLVASARVDRGRRLLSSHPAFVTDRLHGHILGLLLDQPHVVIPDKYGKIRAFVETWGTTSDRAIVANNAQEGARALRELVRLRDYTG